MSKLEKARVNRERRRKVATEYVNSINSRTYCTVCGGQPVEWHHEDHPDKPNDRVSSLRTQGASVERIRQEMDRCEPLCRRHHMIADGRMKNLIGNYDTPLPESYFRARKCPNCGVFAKDPVEDHCLNPQGGKVSNENTN